MSKDPAALMYIDKYLSATAEMDADCVGWYTKLIMHQYDKKDLPNDIEKLAGLCNVKFSEFERFKQVFDQVLKQKFKLNDSKRLENEFAKEIITKRKNFTDKRSKSGNIGYIMKVFYKENLNEIFDCNLVKNYLYSLNIEELNQAKSKEVLKQMLKQNGKLYINKDVNKDINIDVSINKEENFVLEIINENQLRFEPLKMKFNDLEDLDYAIEQYSLSEMSKDNPIRDVNKIFFSLSKWLNTWRKNQKEKPYKLSEVSKILFDSEEQKEIFEFLYPNRDYKKTITDFFNHKIKEGFSESTYTEFTKHFFNWIKLNK